MLLFDLYKTCWDFGTSLLLLQLASIQQTTAYSMYSSSQTSGLFEIKMGSVPFGINNVIGQGKSCDSDLACGRMCIFANNCKVAVYNQTHSKCLLTCAPPNFGYNDSGGMVSMERADEVAVNVPYEITDGLHVGAAFHMYGQVSTTPEAFKLYLYTRDRRDVPLAVSVLFTNIRVLFMTVTNIPFTQSGFSTVGDYGFGASNHHSIPIAAGDYFHLKISVINRNEFLVEINDALQQTVSNPLNTPLSDIGWMQLKNFNNTITVHAVCYL